MYDFFVVPGLVFHAFPPIPGVEISDDGCVFTTPDVSLNISEGVLFTD